MDVKLADIEVEPAGSSEEIAVVMLEVTTVTVDEGRYFEVLPGLESLATLFVVEVGRADELFEEPWASALPISSLSSSRVRFRLIVILSAF